MLLIVGLITRCAAAAVGVLFVVFIVGIIQAARGGSSSSAAASAAVERPISTTYTLDILRDVGLLALAVFLVLWPMTSISVDGSWPVTTTSSCRRPSGCAPSRGQRKYNAMLEARKQEAADPHAVPGGRRWSWWCC